MNTKAFATLLLLTLTCAHVSAQDAAKPKDDQISIVVGGEVNKPGRYTLPQHAMITDALDAAGGLRIYAVEKVRLVRGSLVRIVSLKKIRLDPSLNVFVQDGDVLQVPETMF